MSILFPSLSGIVIGDLLVLLSAACASSYMVMYKKLLGNMDASAVNIFLSFIGVRCVSIKIVFLERARLTFLTL